jgi:hypothetical protein
MKRVYISSSLFDTSILDLIEKIQITMKLDVIVQCSPHTPVIKKYAPWRIKAISYFKNNPYKFDAFFIDEEHIREDKINPLELKANCGASDAKVFAMGLFKKQKKGLSKKIHGIDFFIIPSEILFSWITKGNLENLSSEVKDVFVV